MSTQRSPYGKERGHEACLSAPNTLLDRWPPHLCLSEERQGGVKWEQDNGATCPDPPTTRGDACADAPQRPSEGRGRSPLPLGLCEWRSKPCVAQWPLTACRQACNLMRAVLGGAWEAMEECQKMKAQLPHPSTPTHLTVTSIHNRRYCSSSRDKILTTAPPVDPNPHSSDRKANCSAHVFDEVEQYALLEVSLRQQLQDSAAREEALREQLATLNSKTLTKTTTREAQFAFTSNQCPDLTLTLIGGGLAGADRSVDGGESGAPGAGGVPHRGEDDR